MGIHYRMIAWAWVVLEIRTHVGDASWTHDAGLDSIADIFSDTFALMGNCRFPLYITGGMVQEWFDSWKLISEQPMERNGWSFWDSGTEPVLV